MGESKKLRKQITSLLRRVAEHELKIAREIETDTPDYGLIRHWQTEINGWNEQVERKMGKLPARRR